MKKFYAGIGSRRTPTDIQRVMTLMAQTLCHRGYTLRSGGASGADRAFEAGANGAAEIFYSKDTVPWALDEVKKYIPNDRQGFDNWKPYTKGLLARNMMQVLGRNGDEPVEFVLCWAPSLKYEDSSSGGTGWAIRCALAHNIPVYNFFDERIPIYAKDISFTLCNVLGL